MTDTVNIAGIDKGALLAALYNNSQPLGMGWVQAAAGPVVMTAEQGSLIVAGRDDRRVYFDYLFGRPLKVNLSGDEINPWGYDRDNGGPGTFAAIVAKLREDGAR